MSWPLYWLSASVLTMTSAPSFSAASRPAWNAAARPLLFVSLTMWCDAVGAGDLDRAVGRAVVDDQHFDHVEARDLTGEVCQRRGQRLLLVEAGDLDDELHEKRGGDGARREGCVPYTRGPSISEVGDG